MPISDWLLHEKSEDWDERVHCCGNIVVPAQAQASLQLLARLPASS